MKNFHKYKHRPWFRTFRRLSGQLVVPFIIFQFIRTIFLPTIFDVLLLSLFIVIAISIYFEII
ncbi:MULTISPECIES: hypothetical protein [Neobacillus]|uniref:Membrane protein YszA n=2 Tax=Neobacillus TaxID=2675232 RepID=A0A942UB24_9BACI|nr:MULTISPECIES: hypothetical protein [Neobacillus]MBS4215463.1 hypothetical protein [Neobacillus rhizophilus]MBU8916641.1 hypothetical protein [Bacillus sp. FJAT-29953]MCH6269431.1 hypothetical protein [Neobacillus citreus]